MNILLIEDEVSLAEAVREALEEENYTVDVALDGDTGCDKALAETYELVLLDMMLPGVDGMEILATMRESGIDTPVLILTARTGIQDRVKGLDSGADDYMTKPFEMEELLARVRALLRRNYGQSATVVTYGDVKLDTKNGILVCEKSDKHVNITGKELTLMNYLFINQGQTLSRMQLSDRVWGQEQNVRYNNVEAYLSFLRRKLEFVGSRVEIRSVRGIGYTLEYKE